MRMFLVLGLGIGLVAALPGAASSQGMVHGAHDARALPPEAQAELAEVRAAIARYRDIEVAKAEGWTPWGPDGLLMGQHWHRKDAPQPVAGEPLDFSRPWNLMYTRIGDRMALTGVSFLVRIGPDEPVPEGFSGDADLWHVHDFEAIVAAITAERPLLRRIASKRMSEKAQAHDGRMRAAMVHAWITLPNPDGPFALNNRLLPYLKLGLPESWADGASYDVAMGLGLATESGCQDHFRGRLWVAAADWSQKRRIGRACTEAAERVRAGLGQDRATLEALAAAAWQEVDAVFEAELSAEQLARIDAMVEHGPQPGHGEGHR